MTPGPLRFEGRDVPVRDGDTVASALFRAGVRTFSRSLKAHRRRGLYCGTGECPNCTVTVDGVPGVRSCITPAASGMLVDRGTGMAVGRPRPPPRRGSRAPADAGRVLPEDVHPAPARVADGRAGDPARDGFGAAAPDAPAARMVARYVRCETIVVGAGIAGLTAALEAAEGGEGVLLCDEFAIGSRLAPGPTLDAVRALETRVRSTPAIEILEGTPRSACSTGRACRWRARASSCTCAPSASWWRPAPPRRTSSSPATTCPASGWDAPHPRWRRCTASRRAGAWWSSRPPRKAWSTCGRSSRRGPRSWPPSYRRRSWTTCRGETEAIVDGELVQARGHGRLRSVVVRERGERRRIGCDALVLSMVLAPRDELARMAVGEPVRLVGDAALDADEPRLGGGYLCLCEDVALHDAEQAWTEGFRSADQLKRYTTATMGPARARCAGARWRASRATTRTRPTGVPAHGRRRARPCGRSPWRRSRPPSTRSIEKRTGLHDVHLAAGATLGWSSAGSARSPYGDPAEEYRAVRERVGIMDVGTLGRFLIAGRDAASLAGTRLRRDVDDLAARPLALRARARRGRVRGRRRAAVRARGRLVPADVHLRRRRTHGRLAARLGRPPRTPRASGRPDLGARRDPWSPVPGPATSSSA